MKADTFHSSTFADISQFPLTGLPQSIFSLRVENRSPLRTGQALHAESSTPGRHSRTGQEDALISGDIHSVGIKSDEWEWQGWGALPITIVANQIITTNQLSCSLVTMVMDYGNAPLSGFIVAYSLSHLLF